MSLRFMPLSTIFITWTLEAKHYSHNHSQYQQRWYNSDQHAHHWREAEPGAWSLWNTKVLFDNYVASKWLICRQRGSKFRTLNEIVDSSVREDTLVFFVCTMLPESIVLNVNFWPTRWSSKWSLVYKFCDKIFKYSSPYLWKLYIHKRYNCQNVSFLLTNIRLHRVAKALDRAKWTKLLQMQKNTVTD